ncbi:HEAT repeat domain-containing protein, partial [Muriicola sp.]|uniref:HEAT repeat domain-containing protein n=1 Tax=Muriicola sp. TaxID=2020856 RepID=UPI003C78D109
VVTKGIVELTQMQVEQAYTFIRKYINHKRSVIRKQAQIATVSLKPEGIIHFLDTNRYAISEWQQIKILEILQGQEDFIPPSFGAWLTSKNKDVVLFSLRLIRHYNQTDANCSVTELLKHKDDEIKQAAIECIKEFGIIDAIPVLLAAFSRSKRTTKIEILDALGVLGSEEMIPTLFAICETETNFNVKSKAISAINHIKPNSVLPKENLDPAIKVGSETNSVAALNEFEPSTEMEEKKEPPKETMEEEVVIIEEDNEYLMEDLDVFEVCFMEELNEILDRSEISDNSIEVKYLPLDFLPIVVQKKTDMAKKKQKKRSVPNCTDLEVIFHEVHPDEAFRIELENVLSRVEVPNLDGTMEIEYLNFRFVPFVIDDREDKNKLPALLKEINAMEVNGVEIVLPEPDKEDHSFTEEQSSAINTQEEDQDTCSFVNWEDLEDEVETAEQNIEEKSLSAHTDEVPKQDFGFSIFEELFRHCDTESKLILLDEILDLGDAKELCFLQTLFKDPRKEVRVKAKDIAAKLDKKLRTENTEEHTPNAIIKWADGKKGESSLTLNFDLDEIGISKTKQLKK